MTHSTTGTTLPGQLDVVLERLSDAFFALDDAGRCTCLNRAAERLLRERYGALHDSPVGQILWDKLPAVLGTALERSLRLAQADLEVVTYQEYDAPFQRLLETRIFPSEGGVSVLIRDVTRGREGVANSTVRLLGESEQRFRLLVQSIDDVVFRLDRDQRCVDIFGRWLEREGYTPDMFLGRTTREILGPGAATIHDEANVRALAGETVVYEWDLIRPRGNRHMQTSLSPLRDADGEVIGVVGLDRDMTQRFASEREIERLNADLERRVGELQALLDVIPICIGIARDTECRTITVNRTFAQLLGVSPSSNASLTGPNAVALPFRVFHDGVELAADALPIQVAARTGYPVSDVVNEIVRHDGSSHSLLSYAAPLFDEAGKVRGAVGAFLDITERRRREEHQHLLAEASRLLGTSLDMDRTLETIARMALPVLADFCLMELIAEDGAIERTQLAHVDPTTEARLRAEALRLPPDPRAARDPIVQALATGAPVLYPKLTDETLTAMARGERHAAFLRELKPRSLIVAPLRTHGYTIGSLTLGFADSGRRHSPADVALAEDLASRAALAVDNARLFRAAQIEIQRRAEAESRASRWAFIFEQAEWGVAIGSADGRRIEAANPAFARMHGYTPEEITGCPVSELFPRRRRAELRREFRLLQAQGHHIWESEQIRKDGTVFPVLIDIAAIKDAAGRIQCYAATTQDLTERQRAEEQLRQAQKMDAVGRLAGGLAHDLNNLLMIILGFSDFLLGAIESDDARRGDAVEIRKAADRAASLTRQLLSLGHPSILKRQTVDLNDIVRDLDPMLRPLLREDIRIVLRLSGGLGGVAADRGQLEQVVMNLALNGRDAMPNGGELSIETIDVDLPEGYAYRHVGIDIPAGPYVMLIVSDTGQGMSAEVKARLFEPFFTTKPSSNNTGLGLATVYSIVKQTGGYVWVDSEPREGAAFKICLPRVEPVAARHGGMRDIVPTLGGSECLLLVEDEQAVLGLAGRVLAGLGYSVLEAANGREALQIARDYPGAIDLMLTDVVMPEMGGLELIEALGAIRPGIGVAVMSGYMEPERLRADVREAGVPFLPKPFSPDSLGRKVRETLDRRARALE